MRLKRVSSVFFFAFSLISSSFADYMILEGGAAGSPTTGDQFEGVADEWATHSVLEITGLQISARTTDAAHTLNANKEEFGIDSNIVGENSEAFDFGEVMELYFDKDVEFSVLDFNRFETGDCFVLELEGSDPLEIENHNLSSGTYDTYDFAEALRVSAGTTIRFYVRSDSGAIGMDRIGLQVVPEPTAATLISFTGISLLLIRRFSCR
ncbi:MAG: hypothetical protein JXR23_00730 [Pontiellaceae bacterium]|nr:hypothetical protein [Pontiellaceae bacterium]